MKVHSCQRIEPRSGKKKKIEVLKKKGKQEPGRRKRGIGKEGVRSPY